MTEKKPKCRVNWNKPTRAGTICNYVDEVTNECKQTDWKRCPCGGIVRYPRFDELPWKESDRIDAMRAYLNKDVIAELEHRAVEYRNTAKRIECAHPSYMASGIDEAIALILGDVE